MAGCTITKSQPYKHFGGYVTRWGKERWIRIPFPGYGELRSRAEAGISAICDELQSATAIVSDAYRVLSRRVADPEIAHRGFKQLNPYFAIRDAGNDEHRLPTSSTCVNLLKVKLMSARPPLLTSLFTTLSSFRGTKVRKYSEKNCSKQSHRGQVSTFHDKGKENVARRSMFWVEGLSFSSFFLNVSTDQYETHAFIQTCNNVKSNLRCSASSDTSTALSFKRWCYFCPPRAV